METPMSNKAKAESIIISLAMLIFMLAIFISSYASMPKPLKMNVEMAFIMFFVIAFAIFGIDLYFIFNKEKIKQNLYQ